MIKLLQHKEIDKTLWDQVISRSHNSLIYGYSWYLDIVSPGWQALVLENYEAEMPLPVKKKLSFRICQQPLYTQQLGIFSEKNISPDLAEEFYSHLQHHAKYINLQLNYATPPPAQNFRVTRQTNLILPLDKSYADLKKQYHKSHARNIKNAQKSNFPIEKNISPEEMDEVLRKNLGGVLKNIPAKEVNKIRLLIIEAQKRNMFEARVFRHESGEAGAAIFLYKNNSRLTYIFAAGDDFSKKNGINHLLLDQLIEEYAGTNWTLDFEGSSIPSIAKFYRRFGAVEQNYLQIKRNSLPLIIKWLKK